MRQGASASAGAGRTAGARWAAVALVGLLLLTGCGRVRARVKPETTGAIPIGASTQSIDGRTVEVYRPGSLPPSAPLVLMLHGGFGSGSQAESAYRWDDIADAHGVLIAYPDGLDKAWNAGSCCGQPAATGVDDVAFLQQVVTTLEQRVSIDPDRVYATGMSNGALMSYRLACETGTFAAIAPVAGTLVVDCPDPAKISVLAIHGLADTRVPYNGGVGSGAGHVDGLPVPDAVQLWRAVDGCGPATASTAGVVTTWSTTCPAGYDVTLITVADAGHQWPGSADKPLADALLGLDPPSTAIDATTLIWDFFAAHSKIG